MAAPTCGQDDRSIESSRAGLRLRVSFFPEGYRDWRFGRPARIRHRAAIRVGAGSCDRRHPAGRPVCLRFRLQPPLILRPQSGLRLRRPPLEPWAQLQGELDPLNRSLAAIDWRTSAEPPTPPGWACDKSDFPAAKPPEIASRKRLGRLTTRGISSQTTPNQPRNPRAPLRSVDLSWSGQK